MSQDNKLSLLAAIFININIMVGAGLFINTTNLAAMVGAAGFVSYILLAILLYPMIASIAKLVTIYPSGGFYSYGKQLHPMIGFIGAWSYFVGKLASAVILIHASMLLFGQIIPTVGQLNIYVLDLSALALFLGLNLFNLQTGFSIQVMFLVIKLIPILFVVASGLYLFSPGNYGPVQFQWAEFVGTLPLVLYAAIGFEATTSLSGKIKDAHKNGPRAILISYALVMGINIAYQFFFYGAVGQQLKSAGSFLYAFPLLLAQLFGMDASATITLQALFNIAIASSALGGAYGILFSNSWNLHTLAQHKHITNGWAFLKENRYHTPYLCVFAEGIVCLIYLIATRGQQIPLQQIAAFGCTIAYTTSIVSLFVYMLTHNRSAVLLPLLGLGNCMIFLMSCLHSFATEGYTSLITFGGLMLCGVLMYCWQEYSLP